MQMGGKLKVRCCPQTNGLVLLTAALFVLAQIQQTHSQSTSSYGKEFYTGFMSNIGGTSFTSLRLTIGTNSSAADYVVESIADGIIEEGTVLYGSPVTIEISSDFQVTNSGFDNRAKGIHVYITNDATIFLIANNFLSSFNHGVFLAYPCLTFEFTAGTSYEYYVISADSAGGFNSQILLVGCEDETIVTVTPAQLISIPENIQEESSGLVSIEAGISSNKLSINQMQTLLISSTNNLILTKIVSNKPLTVIAGHECASVPFFISGCEPLAFQVPPSITWGTHFLLAPFAGRDTASTFKVITVNESSVNIACINAESPLSFRLKGDFEFTTSQYCYLQSSQPLLVVVLALSGVDGKGDPAIAQVSPIDQYVNEISFLSLPSNAFSINYISVTVPIEHFIASSIFFDGEILSCQWNLIVNDTETMQPIGYGCNFTIPSTAGTSFQQHYVSHSNINGLISVLVYGFNSRPNTGYAYLAGQQILIGDDMTKERDALPMFDITDFPGVLELERVKDAASDAIYIPNGLILGEELVTTVFVNENGAISFQDSYKYSLPDRFPTSFHWTQQSKVVAPFWADNDIRKKGAVRYASYCNITGKQQCQIHEKGQAILNEINTYIQGTQAESDKIFIGNWMLIALWDHVHPSPHGDNNTRGIPEEILSKTNTYQAIIISDAARTFAVFTFLCGGVEWSAVGSGRAAVQGYNVAGNYFFNHRLSGYLEIGDAVACIAGQGKRRKREADDAAMDEIMCLPADDVLMEVTSTCNLFSLVQRELLFGGVNMTTSLNNISMLLPPCPPTSVLTDLDSATFRPQPDVPQCYVSVLPVSAGNIIHTKQVDVTQQCCYNYEKALVTEAGGKDYAGSMLFQNPLREPEMYSKTDSGPLESGDKQFRDSCCDSRLLRCDDFFDARKPTDVQNNPVYRAMGVGVGMGDPHYKPFDWKQYEYHHYQGEGDFTIMEVIVDEKLVFTLQGRLEDLNDNGYTWHVGLACGGSDIAFEFFPTFSVIQTKPGTPINITGQLQVGEAWQPQTDVVPPYTVELRKTSSNTLVADFFISRVSLVVTFTSRFMNYEVRTSNFDNTVLGLLGNFDGNPTNEFVKRGTGEQIAYTYPMNQDFMMGLEGLDLNTWRVTENSLFSKPTRQKRQTGSESEPFNFDDLTFTEEQRKLCKNSPQCLIDLHASGDMNIALFTLRTEEEANETIETSNNLPPNVTANLILRVTVNQESVLLLSVTDPDGDNVTLSMQGGLPDNSVLQGSEGKYAFHWTPQQATSQPIVFLATDSRGAASLFSPRVEVCACVNGGNCTLDGVLSNHPTVVLNCLCTEAFDGRFCEEDRNGCSEIQCFVGVECMDIPAPGVGAVCGNCPPGFTGDSQKCYDINECLLSNDCEQLCNNTEGRYFCTCKQGYRLTNATHCGDIDECAGINDCQQLCFNTLGSYECNCMEGFTLEGDGRNCTANELCDGTCSFGCAVINEEEQCFCQAGFDLSEPGGSDCVDRDECAMETACQQICINTNGSFKCSCKPGYQLLNDGQSCEDIDECFVAAIEATSICESDPKTRCINTNGSFGCLCVQGFFLNDNGTCERINNEPLPPPPPVILPAFSEDNSVNYTASFLTSDIFTPERRQRFRHVASEAVTNYCAQNTCELIINKEIKQRVNDLKVNPANVVLPLSFVFEDEEGKLVFTLYIQIGDGFLSIEQLKSALMQAEEQFRKAGFLFPITEPTNQPHTTLPAKMKPATVEPTVKDCPPYCTVEYCSAKSTRTALCTLQEPGNKCDLQCRVTYCHTCYYDDDYRPLLDNCAICSAVEFKLGAGQCFKMWATCIRRTDGQVYPKVRVRERTRDRFKCYEHPCT